MNKIAILILSVFIGTNALFAQTQALQIKNENSDQERIIKENKRVRIKTVDGKKVSGRVSFENDSVVIDRQKLALTDIEEIKRDPLLISILISGLLIYGGSITAGMGVLIGLLVDSSGFWLTIPAAGLVYAGVKSPNFNRKYELDGKWSLELITISD